MAPWCFQSREYISIVFQRMVSKCAHRYDGLTHSSPLQIHAYFSYFSTLQSRLRLSAVVSRKPHPSINLSLRTLKTPRAVSDSPNLKSPILWNSQFAKYNAHQISRYTVFWNGMATAEGQSLCAKCR